MTPQQTFGQKLLITQSVQSALAPQYDFTYFVDYVPHAGYHHDCIYHYGCYCYAVMAAVQMVTVTVTSCDTFKPNMYVTWFPTAAPLVHFQAKTSCYFINICVLLVKAIHLHSVMMVTCASVQPNPQGTASEREASQGGCRKAEEGSGRPCQAV